MPDEQGFPLPLEDDIFALGYGIQVDFYFGQSKYICRGCHGHDELVDGVLCRVGGDDTPTTEDDIGGDTPAQVVRVLVCICSVRMSVLVKAGYRKVGVAIASLHQC